MRMPIAGGILSNYGMLDEDVVESLGWPTSISASSNAGGHRKRTLRDTSKHREVTISLRDHCVYAVAQLPLTEALQAYS